MLRRTREVNARYLPPLSNYVVFCRRGMGDGGWMLLLCFAGGAALPSSAAAALLCSPAAPARPHPPRLPPRVRRRPTAAQLRAYSAVLGSSSVRKLLSASGADFGDRAL